MGILSNEYPNLFDFILQQVTYLNFSRIEYMDSSTDLREPKGSVLLNPRFNKTENINEIIAWSSQGLYHEAKHWQFFDTYQYEGIPGSEKSNKNIFSNIHPIIPCSWKAVPSERTLDDSLLAMQAFIPGMTLALKLLKNDSQYSGWLKERVELEMRTINGAIATLIIGKDYLTDEGHIVFSELLHDYHNYLIPSYSDIQSKVE